jgi:hypothetical protein
MPMPAGMRSTPANSGQGGCTSREMPDGVWFMQFFGNLWFYSGLILPYKPVTALVIT